MHPWSPVRLVPANPPMRGPRRQALAHEAEEVAHQRPNKDHRRRSVTVEAHHRRALEGCRVPVLWWSVVVHHAEGYGGLPCPCPVVVCGGAPRGMRPRVLSRGKKPRPQAPSAVKEGMALVQAGDDLKPGVDSSSEATADACPLFK